jgi:hypothetical protein
MTEGLPGIYVGDVHFDKRYGNRCLGIAKSNTGVGIGSGVNDDEFRAILPGLMNGLHQFLLAVTLQARQGGTGALSLGLQAVVDFIERFRPIDLRLAGTKQVQIGAVQY